MAVYSDRRSEPMYPTVTSPVCRPMPIPISGKPSSRNSSLMLSMRRCIAIAAAVAMQRRMLSINDELREEGFPEIGIGIGLHTGEVTVGYIGSERRSEYTAIGDAVNTAPRLQSNAK